MRLYHLVPPHMFGTTLYPLNLLKDKAPAAFEAALEGYRNREWLQRERIPLLNCFWGDVLFLSAVHPARLRSALRSEGHDVQELAAYAISDGRLEDDRLVTFMQRYGGEAAYAPYDRVGSSRYKTIPEDTFLYYGVSKRCGGVPLLYQGVPQILYHGPIDVRGTEIVRG